MIEKYLRRVANLLLGVLLAMAATTAILRGGSPALGAEPVPTARQFIRQATYRVVTLSGNYGSAVLIKPGLLISSAHIFMAPGVPPPPVEGLRVIDPETGTVTAVHTLVTLPEPDLAFIAAPGLECPCAALYTDGTPAVDSEVATAGYSFLWRVLTITEGRFLGEQPFSDGLRLLASTTVTPGMSGGGMWVPTKAGPVLAGIIRAVPSYHGSPVWGFSASVPAGAIRAALLCTQGGWQPCRE